MRACDTTRTDDDSVAADSGSASSRVSEAERVVDTADPVGCDGMRAADVDIGVLIDLVAGLIKSE